MNVLQGLESLRSLPHGSVLSIGNFDGMHLGHQRLLRRAVELKQTNAAPATTVVTFEPHPLTVLRPEQAPPRLTTAERRRELLAAAGVDALVELPPSRQVLDLTAETFWELLRDGVRPSHLVEGPSFNFGRGRGGTIELLRQWSAAAGVQLHVMESVTAVLTDMLLVTVSSSIIRRLLAAGRVRDAAACLGRQCELNGTVVAGARRGRELGFPTANLRCDDQLIPADGIYAGRCRIDSKLWPVAVSIGTNPTFGDNPRTVEGHLIGFTGDLYDRALRLELIDWQRDQRKFAGLSDLKDRIARDLDETLLRLRIRAADPAASV